MINLECVFSISIVYTIGVQANTNLGIHKCVFTIFCSVSGNKIPMCIPVQNLYKKCLCWFYFEIIVICDTNLVLEDIFGIIVSS